MKVSTKELYKHCYGKYAIAGVNVAQMEQVFALFKAASEADSPIVIQATPLQRNYSHPRMIQGMVESAAQVYPNVVYAMHLDHGNEAHVLEAIRSEFYTSVMIDASRDDFQTNIERTRVIASLAHPKGIAVEAELGVLSGVEDNITIAEEKAQYTNPEMVREYVNMSGCDSLAVAIGTSHGAYKFTKGQGIQMRILEDINKNLPGFPLVVHGGSTIDPEEIARINAAGGSLNENAKGIDIDELISLIPLGVCKINMATDLRLLWTRITREFFVKNPQQFRPMMIGEIYMEEYKKLMIKKFELLGSKGQTSAFKTSLI